MNVLVLLAALTSAALADDTTEAPQPPAYLLQGPMPESRPSSPGSLWDETRARVIIGMDYNARQPGDLITVTISEETRTELLADTASSRESSVGGGIGSFFGLVNAATGANPNLGGQIGLQANGNSEYRGDGSTRREGLLSGQVTCRVMAVEPNGNLVVWGTKELSVNRENQYLVLTGVVRPRDIRADNSVLSHFVAEARIAYNGSGVVADKQGPGIGHRVVDHVWPF